MGDDKVKKRSRSGTGGMKDFSTILRCSIAVQNREAALGKNADVKVQRYTVVQSAELRSCSRLNDRIGGVHLLTDT